MSAPEWSDAHWRSTFAALLSDWARLKGISPEVARLYWPTHTPPLHTAAPALTEEPV